MKSVEEFKSELSSELPIRSSKDEVEKYLTRLGLEHSYVDSEKKFYAIVRNIGQYRIIYDSNLLIRIRLDASNRVQEIEYEIEHSGL